MSLAKMQGHRMIVRVIAAMVVTIASAVFVAHAAAQEPRGVQTLFTQQDSVQAFDFVTGHGSQVGTAIGLISGTTSVDFQFTVAGPPSGDVLPIAFHNRVIVTDIDGDQIFFDNDGTGSFHLGIPGAPFQGTGGPLRGTYVVTGGTGKYSSWKVGTVFNYRAVASNPPAPPDRLGTVYVEISFRGHDDLK